MAEWAAMGEICNLVSEAHLQHDLTWCVCTGLISMFARLDKGLSVKIGSCWVVGGVGKNLRVEGWSERSMTRSAPNYACRWEAKHMEVC